MGWSAEKWMDVLDKFLATAQKLKRIISVRLENRLPGLSACAAPAFVKLWSNGWFVLQI